MNQTPPSPLLLLTGASGFLGWNLLRQPPAAWRLAAVGQTRAPAAGAGCEPHRLDLTRYDETRELLRRLRPATVLHAAALADLNRCQREPELARRINLDAAINLAGLCADANIPCLFVSTDMVFDGQHAPYAEEAAPAPVNRYGELKALAEAGMRARCPQLTVVRLPLMYGDGGPQANSFLQGLAAALRAGAPARLFTDEIRTPLSGRSAAAGLYHLLRHAPTGGFFHLGGPERISRHAFGLRLARLLGVPSDSIQSVRQAEVPMDAARPADVSLLCPHAQALGWQPPPLDDDLAAVLTAMNENAPTGRDSPTSLEPVCHRTCCSCSVSHPEARRIIGRVPAV
jgi:dTDP-4-dehydrorhamnose reductase